MRGFEIDQRAFRAQNIGRPATHLIREAVQNAFDAAPANVTITIKRATGGGLQVIIEDDGPGFKDVNEIWTIFASGKRDDCTKRGRLGRGLKELISVAAEAQVLTAGKKASFKWTGKTIDRRVSKAETTGTKIVATVRHWKVDSIADVEKYLALFIPPKGVEMTVNGTPNVRPEVVEEFRCMIKTVVYSDEGVPNEPWRTTDVRLMRADRGRWIYEMGIPVEEIPDADGFEWSIDVGQRTPLRPERDMLPRSYVHNIYAEVANHLMDRLPVSELGDLWMEEAVGNFNFDKNKHGKTYIERRFGANAARATVNDPDRNAQAERNGVTVIHTNHLGSPIRGLISEFVPTTAELYPKRIADTAFIPTSEWTECEKDFVRFAKWLASQLKLVDPQMMLIDSPGANVEANTHKGEFIRVNRSGVGQPFFETPEIRNWLPLIVHELAHRAGTGHDEVFWRECERLHGEAAQVMFFSGWASPVFGDAAFEAFVGSGVQSPETAAMAMAMEFSVPDDGMPF